MYFWAALVLVCVDVYMLNSVDERMPPCGMPVLN